MPTITADFKVVTPMFLGGADNRATAELRAASFKGVLRFWWRALNGHLALKDLSTREQRVFGSDDSAIGQSSFLIRIVPGAAPPTVLPAGSILKDHGAMVLPGARYLGYGLIGAFGQNAGRLSRPCLAAGAAFSVELRFRPKTSEADITSVRNALVLFGLLGGLGARSRRGWGSVALLSLKENGTETFKACSTRAGYRTELNKIVPRFATDNNSLPKHTALSRYTRITLVEPSNDLAARLGIDADDMTSLQCLAAVGSAMLRYRSWGQGGKVRLRDQGAEPVATDKTFHADHDWYHWFIHGGHANARPKNVPQNFHPVRVAFGLPHNYHGVGVTGANADRRASPLFIHIHQLASETPFAVVIVMPGQFLPGDPPGTIKLTSPGAARNVAANIDWKSLYGFLDCNHFDTDATRRIDVLAGAVPPS